MLPPIALPRRTADEVAAEIERCPHFSLASDDRETLVRAYRALQRRVVELEGAIAGERTLRDVQEARHNAVRGDWQTSIDRAMGELTLARHQLADAQREIRRLTRPGGAP